MAGLQVVGCRDCPRVGLRGRWDCRSWDCESRVVGLRVEDCVCVVGCKKNEFRVRIAWDCKAGKGWGGEVEDCKEEENVGLRSRVWLCDWGNAIRRS